MYVVVCFVFYLVIFNIQIFWVKMGWEGIVVCFNVGVNDFGGMLMNEFIICVVGIQYGQELVLCEMEVLICLFDCILQQCLIFYGILLVEQVECFFDFVLFIEFDNIFVYCYECM